MHLHDILRADREGGLGVHALEGDDEADAAAHAAISAHVHIRRRGEVAYGAVTFGQAGSAPWWPMERSQLD